MSAPFAPSSWSVKQPKCTRVRGEPSLSSNQASLTDVGGRAQSKDPEVIRMTMQHQGVLTKHLLKSFASVAPFAVNFKYLRLGIRPALTRICSGCGERA